MWEKIKKFFKWIAEHTGTSWIARKISSGWKWLFGGKANATQQNTSQQEKSSGNERQEPAQAQSKSTTTPKTQKEALNENYLKVEEIPNSEKSKRESSTINVFDGKLELCLADDIQQKLEDYKHKKNNGKYRAEIHCNKSDFKINFSKKENGDGSVSLFISALQKIGDNRVFNDIDKMKSSLSFKEGSTFVVIDSIQKYQPLAKGATKGVDNSQHGASVNDSTSNSGGSSFENVGVSELPENKEDNLVSLKTNGRGDDTNETFYGFDENLGEQLEVDGAKEKEPTTLFTAPSVQAAGNDKTSNKL